MNRASACPPAQANAQNGGGRPASPSSSSVLVHSGTASEAVCSTISGTNGTGNRRVLTRMKATGSEMTAVLAAPSPVMTMPEKRAAARSQAAHLADELPLFGGHRLHRQPRQLH